MKQTSVALGRRIKKIRESLNLTQAEFARRIGLAGGHAPISRYETGQVRPEDDLLERIAVLAGKSLSWLTTPQIDSRNLEDFAHLCEVLAESGGEQLLAEMGDDDGSYLLMLSFMLCDILGDDSCEQAMKSVLNGGLPGVTVRDLHSYYSRLLGGEPYQPVRDHLGLLVEMRQCQDRVAKIEAKLDRLLGLLAPEPEV